MTLTTKNSIPPAWNTHYFPRVGCQFGCNGPGRLYASTRRLHTIALHCILALDFLSEDTWPLRRQQNDRLNVTVVSPARTAKHRKQQRHILVVEREILSHTDSSR